MIANPPGLCLQAQIWRVFYVTGASMLYEKPALTYEAQADQLLKRGLSADKETLIQLLQQVSYYRLSGYWYPFRQNPGGTFPPGIDLNTIWRRYTFDRQLRLLVLDGIERVEIALRTDITYQLGHNHGPFGYNNPDAFPNLEEEKHQALHDEIQKEYDRSKETFARHFQNKYGDEHDTLPIWMATEVISFGALFTMYRGVKTSTRKAIAKKYKINERVLLSWLGTLNAARNICAHHSRLWNKELGYKPLIPLKNLQWQKPVTIPRNRVFVILSIIQHMLQFVAPQSQWPERLKALLKKYDEIPLRQMGFPDHWQEIPFWKN